MSKVFPPKIVFFVALLLSVALVGCTHQKTNRGHLLRGDWAVEYNRTPWIGCPPDSGCSEENENNNGGLFDCLKKDCDKKKRGIRRHCGLYPECVPKNPCCRTLGCGMWLDTDAASTSVAVGGEAQACGLTPFCLPQKPCGLFPNCGKPASPTSSMLSGNVPGGMPIVRGMSHNGVMPGTLVSRGIVPGASAISSGGMVAAIGVSTPAGTMMPVGVRLPNGTVSDNHVLRACMMSPRCTTAHPCGLTPNCGGAVAVNLVANNAIALASALQAQGVAGGVMQASGSGMLVNPITNQPINGLSMAGYPQMGYPPIDYAPTGYSPGYPQFAAGMIGTGEPQEMEEEEEAMQVIRPETRSSMPVPRFHPIPSKPTFQRSEGMPSTPASQRTVSKPTTTAMNERRGSSMEDLEAALDQAYLEGVSAAMDEVERKLEEKRLMAAKAKMQEKILRQAEYVQQQLDEQERAEMLAMQQMRHEQQLRQQLRQQAAQQQPMQQEMLAESLPKRLPPPQSSPMVAQTNNSVANHHSSINPAQLAENLKSSVAHGVNGMLAPFKNSNQKGQVAAMSSQRTTTNARVELASAAPELPGRPPVASASREYGLLPDKESGSGIVQAQFTADHAPITP